MGRPMSPFPARTERVRYRISLLSSQDTSRRNFISGLLIDVLGCVWVSSFSNKKATQGDDRSPMHVIQYRFQG